jgi:hypothetical protein
MKLHVFKYYIQIHRAMLLYYYNRATSRLEAAVVAGTLSPLSLLAAVYLLAAPGPLKLLLSSSSPPCRHPNLLFLAVIVISSSSSSSPSLPPLWLVLFPIVSLPSPTVLVRIPVGSWLRPSVLDNILVASLSRSRQVLVVSSLLPSLCPRSCCAGRGLGHCACCVLTSMC